MIGREKRVLLRHYLEQGMSKAAIARQLRISRRTVYNWMEAGELDRGVDDKAVRYRPRAPLPSKLDPFREIIRTRLADYPELSAVRLFEEVKMAGYPGGYGQVKRYVRAVRPRDPVEPVVRFETPPGHQAQVDFAEFRLPWGKRHALIVVLGYSRRMWLRFYERQTMMVVIRGIEESFPYLGGVPVELLFDQMKAVVIADGRAGGGLCGGEPGVPGLQRPLGLPDPDLPPVPGADEGLYIILHPVGRLRQELGGWVVEWSTCAPAAWRAGGRLAVHTSTGSCRCRGGRGAARDYAIS